jgi:hypothetical protein
LNIYHIFQKIKLFLRADYIEPGRVLMFYFGVGLAVNENLSLSSRITHGFYGEMKADGTKAKGSDYEPSDLGFSCSYRLSDYWVISPHVTFALNADVGSSSYGLSLTRRF